VKGTITARLTECPKCKSTNIFVSQGGGVGWDAAMMVRLGWGLRGTSDWETYLCVDCGYFENYLIKADWLTKIRSDPAGTGWRKVE
jgi:hypothetical protein